MKIGYQLYSARREAEKDLDAVLGELAGMGYDGVELAGLYGRTAEEFAAALRKNGLKAISAHVPFREIEADMFRVLSDYRTIGCEYIAVPYLEEALRPGSDGFAHAIRVIAKFGRLAKEAGIQVLYHNHDFEFARVSGQYGLDFLYDAVDPDALKTELDTCWVKYAGEDPAAYVRKYAGRCPLVHLKDFVGRKADGATPYALIGQGENEAREEVSFCYKPWGMGCQDTDAVVDAARESGAQWLIIEQDESPERPPLEAAALSMQTIRKQGLKA